MARQLSLTGGGTDRQMPAPLRK